MVNGAKEEAQVEIFQITLEMVSSLSALLRDYFANSVNPSS